LFKGIEKNGSISKAAKELGWSYKYAWDQLREMERKLEAPVVIRKRGGATGGGAKLTELAKSLLGKYEETERRVHRAMRTRL
jgi:molybdate transport system regulatory protein